MINATRTDTATLALGTTAPATHPKALVWTGRGLSALIAGLLCLDGVVKLWKPAPVAEAFVQLGYNPETAFGIGIVLLVCTLLYAIPRTAVLGAILLTGYLGGATATHVRADTGLFSVVFPGILGAIAWGGLFLRDARLRALLPLRGGESQ